MKKRGNENESKFKRNRRGRVESYFGSGPSISTHGSDLPVDGIRTLSVEKGVCGHCRFMPFSTDQWERKCEKGRVTNPLGYSCEFYKLVL